MQAFTEHYYNTFDTNRAALSGLYGEQSLLTFEGQKFQGTQNILQKLTTLPFQQCRHNISSIDAQPSLSGGIIVFVTGQLLVCQLANFDFLAYEDIAVGNYMRSNDNKVIFVILLFFSQLHLKKF